MNHRFFRAALSIGLLVALACGDDDGSSGPDGPRRTSGSAATGDEGPPGCCTYDWSTSTNDYDPFYGYSSSESGDGETEQTEASCAARSLGHSAKDGLWRRSTSYRNIQWTPGPCPGPAPEESGVM